MKNKIKSIITVICITLTSKALFADTCPRIESFSPFTPPSGWSLLLPPVVDDVTYVFGAAVHSLSGAYYYGQTICKYAACPNSFCPAFAIISDKTYTLPNTKAYPWNAKSVLAFTFTCAPADHDPSHCEFF